MGGVMAGDDVPLASAACVSLAHQPPSSSAHLLFNLMWHSVPPRSADEELTERERAAIARKPAEHQALFGGNTDDHFRMGIKLTR